MIVSLWFILDTLSVIGTHYVIFVPGQRWILMCINRNNKMNVHENKITPTLWATVYVTILIETQKNMKLKCCPITEMTQGA